MGDVGVGVQRAGRESKTLGAARHGGKVDRLHVDPVLGEQDVADLLCPDGIADHQRHDVRGAGHDWQARLGEHRFQASGGCLLAFALLVWRTLRRQDGPEQRERALLALAFVLLFGWKNLPNAARSLGESMRVFKSEVDEMKKDGKPASDASQTTVQSDLVTSDSERLAAENSRLASDNERLAAEARAKEAEARAAQARADADRFRSDPSL